MHIFRTGKEQDAVKEAKESYENEGAIKTDAVVHMISSRDGKVEMKNPSQVAFDCSAWRNQLYQIDFVYGDPTFRGDGGSGDQWLSKRIFTKFRPHTDSFTVLVLLDDPQISYPEYLLDPIIYPEFSHDQDSQDGSLTTSGDVGQDGIWVVNADSY